MGARQSISVTDRIPRLILTNVDNMLVRSKHKPLQPYVDAIKQTFPGVAIVNWESMKSMSGYSDPRIIDAILEHNNIYARDEDTINKILYNYRSKLQEDLTSNPKTYDWEANPGSQRLAELIHANRDKLKLGLLTGTTEASTRNKLLMAEHNLEFFEESSNDARHLFGAFGDSSDDRLELIPLARSRYAQWLGVPEDRISSDDVLILGNSPYMIKQAHFFDIPCVAVASGDFSMNRLAEAEHVFDKIDENIDDILECCFTTQRQDESCMEDISIMCTQGVMRISDNYMPVARASSS